jgi:thioredoxin reductase (NADPH)
LEFWRNIESEQALNIKYRDRVEKVERLDDSFEVKSQSGSIQCRAVLLTIGRRGTPRKLGVPGEDQKKVVYQLIDPEQYEGQHVLVVGGGDSALEAATSIAEQPGTTVTLSYRSDAFGRARTKNREKVAAQAQAGRLHVMLKSHLLRIAENAVEISHEGKTQTIHNDAIIVCAGGILPTDFLKSIGIDMETKYGTA